MQKIIHFIVTLSMAVMAVGAYAEDTQLTAGNSTKKQETIQPNNTKLEKSDAEKILLHQQPDEKSSVAATIPANQAIIPIFIQGEWTKIADPTNGNVGWVNNETLKKHGMPIIKVMMQSINPANAAQTEEMMKKWEAQRRGIQALFNQMLEQNAKTLDMLAKEFQDPGFPFPIVKTSNKAADTAVKTDNVKSGTGASANSASGN